MKTNQAFTLVELMATITILGVVVLGMGVAIVNSGSVSDGVRTGVVTKFSHKGIWFKSWEGEMIQGGAGNNFVSSSSFAWRFSVLNPEMVPLVERAAEKALPVSVKYHQSLFCNPMVRSTVYTIEKVTFLTDTNVSVVHPEK
jgi:prepilin-type N-terminal cleavage/methylation domain-containing protein